MPLLLDTHAFLWFIDDDPRLSSVAEQRIGDPATRVLVSFDRLLIAQAITEGLEVVSADTIFDSYSIVRVW